MTIIEAREAAMAGKTVIAPGGLELVADDFYDMKTISNDMVFGKWSVKQEPVVFEAEVSIANERLYGSGVGMIAERKMYSLIGKKVRVTVEVIE